MRADEFNKLETSVAFALITHVCGVVSLVGGGHITMAKLSTMEPFHRKALLNFSSAVPRLLEYITSADLIRQDLTVPVLIEMLSHPDEARSILDNLPAGNYSSSRLSM